MRYLRLALAVSIVFVLSWLPMNDAGATSGSVQGSVNENGMLNLVAPQGSVFDAVTFASYGTPNDYQIGTCHAQNSQSIVESLAIGSSSLSISATNDVFGEFGGRLKIYEETYYHLTLCKKHDQHEYDEIGCMPPNGL